MEIKHKIKVKELIEFIFGCFLVALAFNLFMSPNNLVAGGISGLSLVLKHFFGLNPSMIISISNVFLIILSFLLLGKEKTKMSILGSILFPVFVSMTEHLSTYISFKESEMILIAIFGGFKISLGNSMFFTDGTIIVIGAFVFGFNHLMYSLIILYLISTLTDKVVLGISDSKAFYIITSKEKEVKTFVINELKHGVTEFKAKGGYNLENQTVLMSVIPTREYYKLKEGIHNIDKNAFFVAMDSYEVRGGA